MDEIISLKAFFVEGGNQKKSHVILHITEPSVPEEKAKGYFFVIGEINNGSSAFLSKLNEAFNNAQTTYYQETGSKNEEVFETVLKNLNQHIKLFKDGGDINCAIGAVTQKEIIFSFAGNSPILLFYKKNGTETFGTMELGSLTSNPTPEQTNENLFSQLVQGKISPTDFLFLGTHHLKDFFSNERLEKTLTTRSVEQSCQHIENVLRQLNSTYSFGGLIIHGQTPTPQFPTEMKSAQPNLPKSTQSLKNFFNTEKSTSETLSPKFNYPGISRPNTPNQSSPFELQGKPKENRVPVLSLHPTGDSSTLHQPKTILYLKKTGKILFAILTFLWHFLMGFFHHIGLVGIAIINYKNQRRTVVENWQKQLHSYRENIRQLPLITKILVLVCVLLMAIFAGSILSFKRTQLKNEKNKAYQGQLNFIKTKKDNAESALIYSDKNSALAELKAAQNSLSQLSCKTADEKKNCQQIQSQLDQISAKIKNVTVVNPVILTSLNAQNTNNEALRLIKIGNSLLAYNTTNSTILSYNLTTNETTPTSANATNSGYKEASVPNQENYAVFLNSQNQVTIYDAAKNAFKDSPISYPASGNKISSLLMYNGRLYTLDTARNQIYRHDLANDAFSLGMPWIKQPTDLQTASSLTIDGDVYVLKTTGEVLKLTKGIPQPFNLETIDPPLSEGWKIWTYNELKYLYILDPTQKRILIFDKTGKLKTQVTATEFKKPMDMVIDEENKIGFVTDGNQIYKIILPI
jgi:hypothetical protein